MDMSNTSVHKAVPFMDTNGVELKAASWGADDTKDEMMQTPNPPPPTVAAPNRIARSDNSSVRTFAPTIRLGLPPPRSKRTLITGNAADAGFFLDVDASQITAVEAIDDHVMLNKTAQSSRDRRRIDPRAFHFNSWFCWCFVGPPMLCCSECGVVRRGLCHNAVRRSNVYSRVVHVFLPIVGASVCIFVVFLLANGRTGEGRCWGGSEANASCSVILSTQSSQPMRYCPRSASSQQATCGRVPSPGSSEEEQQTATRRAQMR